MKMVAAILCLALGTAWLSPARAEEGAPSFEGLERGSDAAETYRLNALGIVQDSPPSIFVTTRPRLEKQIERLRLRLER